MDAGDFMRIAIGVFFLLFGIGIAYMLLRLAGVFRAAETTVKDVSRELTPVITRLHTVMDEANSELALVEDVTQSLAVTVGAVERTTVAVTQSVAGPIKALAGVTTGIGAALSALVRPKTKEKM